jgi:hypothetical protein
MRSLKVLAVSLCVATLAAAAFPEVAAAQAKLTGVDAFNAILGNTLVGKDDPSDPFALFFARDGRWGKSDGAPGKWAFTGVGLCRLVGNQIDDCAVLEVTGDEATLGNGAGHVVHFTIVPGNVKNL